MSKSKSICFFTLMLVAIGAAASFAQQKTGEEPASSEIDHSHFQPADVFQLQYASNAQISSDGSTIIYSRTRFDIMTDRSKSELWMINDQGKHIPVLTGKNISSARWSPSGDRIIYVTSQDGKAQIHCYWVAQDKSAAISQLTERPVGITWSPDENQIAFFMRVPVKAKPFASLPAKPKGAEWAEPPKMITKLRYRADGAGFLRDGYNQLFVMNADGGSARQITSGDFNLGGNICWAPDSQSIIISANRHEDHEFQPRNSELYLVDLEDQTIEAITDRVGPMAAQFFRATGSIWRSLVLMTKCSGIKTANCT